MSNNEPSHKGNLPQPNSDSGITTAQILTLITSAFSFALIPIFIITSYLYDLVKTKLSEVRRGRIEPEPENTLTEQRESIKSVDVDPVDETTGIQKSKSKKIAFDQLPEKGTEAKSTSQLGNHPTEQLSVQNEKSNHVLQSRMTKTKKSIGIANSRNVNSKKTEMPTVIVHQSKSNRRYGQKSLRNLHLELQADSFFNVHTNDEESQSWLIPNFNIETPNPTPRSIISSTMTIDKSSSPIVDSFPTLFVVHDESSKPTRSSPSDITTRKARLLHPKKQSSFSTPVVASVVKRLKSTKIPMTSVTTGTEMDDPSTVPDSIKAKDDNSKAPMKSIGLKTIPIISSSTACNTDNNPIKTKDMGVLRKVSTNTIETESERIPMTSNESIETETIEDHKTSQDESIESKLEPTKKVMLETETGMETSDNNKDESVQVLNPCTDNKIEHTQTFQPAPPMIPPRSTKKSSMIIQTTQIKAAAESIQACEESSPASTSTFPLPLCESVDTETEDNKSTDQETLLSTKSATKMANLKQCVFPPVSIIPIQSLDDEHDDKNIVIPLEIKESDGFLPSIHSSPQLILTEKSSKESEIKSDSPKEYNDDDDDKFLQLTQQSFKEEGIEENKPEIIPEEPWEFQTHDYYKYSNNIEQLQVVTTPTARQLEQVSSPKDSLLILATSPSSEKECKMTYAAKNEKLIESPQVDDELNKVFKTCTKANGSLESNRVFATDGSNTIGIQSTSVIINDPTFCFSPVNSEFPFYSTLRTISTSKSMHDTGTTKRAETINKTTNTTRNNNSDYCNDREYNKFQFLKEQDELNRRMKWLRNEEELMIDHTAGILAYYSLDKASLQLKLHPNDNNIYPSNDSTTLDCEKLYNSTCTSCVQRNGHNSSGSSSSSIKNLDLENYKPQVKLKTEIKINDKEATTNTSSYVDYLKMNRKRKKGW